MKKKETAVQEEKVPSKKTMKWSLADLSPGQRGLVFGLIIGIILLLFGSFSWFENVFIFFPFNGLFFAIGALLSEVIALPVITYIVHLIVWAVFGYLTMRMDAFLRAQKKWVRGVVWIVLILVGLVVGFLGNLMMAARYAGY